MKFYTLKNALCIFKILVFIIVVFNSAQAQVCGINAGLSKTICISEPLILTGSVGNLEAQPNSRLWTQLSGPRVQFENPNSLRTKVLNTAPGNYVFQLESKCIDGLMARDVVYITIVPEPTTPFVGRDTVVCFNTDIQLNANTPGAMETGKWTVLPNVGMFLPNAQAPNAVYVDTSKTSGVKKFRWTISNGNCSKYAEKQITFSEPAIPVSAGPDTTMFCRGKCLTLNASFPGTGNIQNGLWTVVSAPNTPSFSNATKRNSKLCNLVPGDYILKWTVSGVCLNESANVNVKVLNTNEPPYSIGDQIYTEFCDSPVVTTQVIRGAPRSPGDSVIWEQTLGGTDATIFPSPNQSTITIGNLTGRFPYKFNYTQISAEGCSVTKVHTVYRAIPISGLTQPADITLLCNQTDTSFEIAFDRFSTSVASINRRAHFISGPVDTAKIQKDRSVVSTGSTTDIWTVKGLGAAGTYIYKIEYENSCGSVFRLIKFIVSQTPGSVNSGSNLVLPCRELRVSPVGSVNYPGNFAWSQISGPTIADIDDENSLNPIIENLNHGVYVFRLTNNGGPACETVSKDMTITVTQNPPLVSFAGNDAEICAGNYRLSASIPSAVEEGVWSVFPSNGVTFLPNNNTPNAIVSGLSPNTVYTFTWTVSNACGSLSSNVVLTTGSFYQTDIPNAGEDVCLPYGTNEFFLTGNSSQYSQGNWTALSENSNIVSPQNSTTPVTFLNNSGTYLFEYSLNSPGCAAIKDTISITLQKNISLNAGYDQNICSDQDISIVQLSAYSEGDSTSGVWYTTADNRMVEIYDPYHLATIAKVNNPGNYLFIYSVENGGSCPVSSDSVVVNINRFPTEANAGDDVQVCNYIRSEVVTLNGNIPEIGEGLWQILSAPWSNGSSINYHANGSSINLSNLANGVYRLRYTVTSGSICPVSVDDMELNISVRAYAGSDRVECGSNIINLIGNLNSEGVWSTEDTSLVMGITQTSPNTSIVQVQNYNQHNNITFRYTIPEYGSCASTFDEVVYKLYPVPSASYGGENISLCSNVSSVTLSGNIPQTGTGKWKFISGPSSPWAGVANNTSNDTIFRNLSAGIYEFNYEIGTHPVCPVSSSRVIVSKEVNSKTGGNVKVCEENTVVLKGNVPVLGTGAWKYVSGPDSATDIIYGNPSNPYSTVSSLTFGTHVFSWTIPGLPGCESTTDYMTVRIDSSISNLFAGGDITMCQTDSAFLKLGSVALPDVSYSWSPAIMLDFPDRAQPNFMGSNNAGHYSYTVSGKRGACENFARVQINVLPKPFSFINVNLTNCSAQFFASSPGRGINNPVYNWLVGDTTLPQNIGSGPFQFNFNSSNHQNIILKIVSNDGCVGTDTLEISPYCILPINLLKFTGEISGENALLKWSVANESEVQKYEVQRSENARDFISLGFVQQRINNFLDPNLFSNNASIKYYRLKIYSVDGSVSFSEIVPLKPQSNVSVSVQPNPFVSDVKVKIISPLKEAVQISVIDATGRVISRKMEIIEKGYNEIKINTVSFPPGTYFLKVNSSISQTFKIIKI